MVWSIPEIPLNVQTAAITLIAVLVGRFILSYLIPKKFLRLDGKYIVVTGCDSGIGLSSIDIIVKKTGANVIALCLTEEGTKRADKAGSLSCFVHIVYVPTT